MTTRILRNGKQIFASRDFRPGRVAAFAKPAPADTNPDGSIGAYVIPPDAPQSPFRAGVPYFDADDNIHYRVVRALDPKEGWATAGFWMARWGCTFKELCYFVERGWLDAALEEKSPTKRYRCRDERPIIAHVAAVKARLQVPKSRSTSKRTTRRS